MYDIDIQEVAGKHIVRRYVEEVERRCKEEGMNCEIRIGGMKGGSTYPFNLFERAAGKVGRIKEDMNKKGAGIFERLFSFGESKKEEEEEEEEEKEGKEEEEISSKKEIKDETGIVHVSIKVGGGGTKVSFGFLRSPYNPPPLP